VERPDSRTTIFLTVLSAAVVALALVANATGFGPTTTTVALVLLPVVLLIGLATFVRLVEIGNEDMRLVLAMNRVRHAYLTMHPCVHFLITAPTLVATVDAAIATAIVVLLMQAAAAPSVAVVATGAIAFPVVWGALFSLNAQTAQTLRATRPRFPTPEQDA
jgi:pyrimidine deaminase RibD-like protein